MEDVKHISLQKVHALWHDNTNKILEYHQKKPKVIETNQNTIIKLFYPKKWPSSNNLWPYALRFHRNAHRLHRMGFKVPQIIDINFCPELNIYMVHYHKIPGIDLATMTKKRESACFLHIIQFMNLLHNSGVFFRAIHLSNLIYQADGNIALIDITDMKFKDKALPVYMRYRNLKHLFTNKTDKPYWQNVGIPQAIIHYLALADLSTMSKNMLKYALITALRKDMRYTTLSFT